MKSRIARRLGLLNLVLLGGVLLGPVPPAAASVACCRCSGSTPHCCLSCKCDGQGEAFCTKDSDCSSCGVQ